MKLLVLLAVAACSKPVKSESDCRAEADRFAKLFAGVDIEPAMLSPDDKMHLVERPDLPATPQRYAPLVNIYAHELTYRGALVAPEQLLEELLETMTKLIEEKESGRFPRTNPPDIRQLIFAIDRDAEWSAVANAVESGRKVGFTAPVFVFSIPFAQKPPPRSKIDPELDEIVDGKDAADKATRFAKLIEGVVKTCPSITKIFGQVASEESGGKADTLLRAMPQALVACRCTLDMPSLTSAMWRLLVNQHPTRMLAIDPDALATPITAPADTKWSEVAKQFTSATKNVTLVVH